MSLLSTTLLVSVFVMPGHSINNETCDDVFNCHSSGQCAIARDGDWYCICDNGYTTYPLPEMDDPGDTLIYCNYRQKKQQLAFVLSMTLGGSGADRWYLGLYLTAALKMGWTLGLGCLCMGFCASVFHDCPALVGCYACSVFTGIFVWCIVDWILIASNSLSDGNGVELEPWWLIHSVLPKSESPRHFPKDYRTKSVSIGLAWSRQLNDSPSKRSNYF